METKKRIEQIEKAIEKLESIKSIECFGCFTGAYDPSWNYYYSLSGFLDRKYFSIYITNHKSDPKEEFRNESDKDCEEEIAELINNLLKE